MRHLPFVLNVRGAEKLSNPDKYFEAMLSKIKINAKKSMMDKLSKILNKDNINKSAQRKFCSFRSLF